jgi:putative heme iron utilization protein
MAAHKEEFKSLMERQLAELHERMIELEKLNEHKVEHTPSYDTVHCEARAKHLETLRRLKKLDELGDDTWFEVGAEVKTLIAELRREVEEKETARA